MDKSPEFEPFFSNPDIRHAGDMGEVILDQEWLKENKKAELYYMYRNLYRKGDKKTIEEEELRYDITIIPPRVIGKEFVKTKGHYHPEAAKGFSYPEIYEVLDGKAHYLLQKRSGRGKIEDAVLVEAEGGDKVLISPNYGHITINPAEETLKMANWVYRGFDSIYKDITELKGGAYYELSTGEFIENDNYGKIPELRSAEVTEIPEFGIESGRDMYNLIENPSNLEFLKTPQDYESIFDDLL